MSRKIGEILMVLIGKNGRRNLMKLIIDIIGFNRNKKKGNGCLEMTNGRYIKWRRKGTS